MANSDRVILVVLLGRGKISSLMEMSQRVLKVLKGMASDVTDESEPKNISDNQDPNNQDPKDKE